MKIGRIDYLNTEPYFYHWPSDAFRLIPGSPRELAKKAADGLVDAGPLPLVECWKLESQFDPLGRWGISAREKSGSVFVLSRRPFAELNNKTIGVTHDTSTSAMLCLLLLEKRYGIKARMKRGLERSDDAWLVIGDQALGLRLQNIRDPWSHVTDLATEWWKWQGKPFVFARWVVRKTVSPGDHARLEWILGESLDKAVANMDQVSEAAALKTGFPAEIIERYLGNLIYELTDEAEESARIFKDLLTQSGLINSSIQEGSTLAVKSHG